MYLLVDGSENLQLVLMLERWCSVSFIAGLRSLLFTLDWVARFFEKQIILSRTRILSLYLLSEIL